MDCQNCQRHYRREEFADDAITFGCPHCMIELTLAPSEKLAELRRRGREPVSGAGIHTGQQPPLFAHSVRSTRPLTLWMILLTLLVLLHTIYGVAELETGFAFGGLLRLLICWFVLMPTVVGLKLRHWSALYATYGLFAVYFLVLTVMLTRSSGPAQVVGRTIGVLVCASLAFVWLRWFVRNRQLFTGPLKESSLVDDVYSPSYPRND